MEDHLSNGELAAYLDGSLSAEVKSRVQDHLSECSQCRSEVGDVADVLRSGSRRKRWKVAVPTAAAAAAAAILITGPFGTDTSEPPGAALRSPEVAAEREAVPSVTVLEPASEASVIRDRLVFSWEAVGANVLYRLTLTDESGDPVWSTETDEASIRPPTTLSLEAGATYFWYVDALLTDGTSHTTDVQSFRIMP